MQICTLLQIICNQREMGLQNWKMKDMRKMKDRIIWIKSPILKEASVDSSERTVDSYVDGIQNHLDTDEDSFRLSTEGLGKTPADIASAAVRQLARRSSCEVK